jgi:HAE1 family hydrophobic/amphiphilic exporter-1
MSFARRATTRPVAVAMLFIAITALGIISLKRLPIDLLPDIAYPKLVIYTRYPGLAPSEIERQITTRIEQQLIQYRGIEQVESTSREGLSLVTVRFAWGTNMDFAMLNVRERLDRAGIPTGADRPVVLRTDPMAEPIMTLSVAGKGDLRNTKDLAETVIKRRLEQIDGVAQATVTGGIEREIHVEVEPRILESNGLTLGSIANAIDAANVAGASGTVLRGRYRYNLRTLGEFQDVREIGDVMIRKSLPSLPGQTPASGGQTVPLREVAKIEDGMRDRVSIARYNGQEAIGVLLFKEAGSNTIVVSKLVHGVIAQLQKDYPEVKLDVASDQSGFVASALSNVKQEIVVGGLMAFLVLFLFLRDVRYPVAIALAMPISVIATFALLDAFGITLNIMSLGGLALGVGLLLDNSIVVIENIFRHRQLGLKAAVAAAVGAEELTAAVVTSTLTTVAVFGPIVYVHGVAGQLFGALSIAVATSLLVSIGVSLTLLPTMAARWREDEGIEPSRFQRGLRRAGRIAVSPIVGVTRPFLNWFDRGFARFHEGYERVLQAALRHRGRVVALSLVLVAATIAIGFQLKRSVLPDVDQGAFRARIVLERGTSLEQTAEIAGRLEALLLKDPDVDAVFSRIGEQLAVSGLSDEESGVHTAMLEVRLKPNALTENVLTRIRPHLGQFPANAIALQTGQATALSRLLGGSDADLAVRVTGEDNDTAFHYAQRLEKRLSALTALRNVQLDTRVGQPETRVIPDRERAASYGLTTSQIANAVSGYMAGVRTNSQFIDFDKKVPIVVRLPQNERESLTYLKQMRVSNATPNGVPLGQVMTTAEEVSPSEIRRVGQTRVVSVQADIATGDLKSALAAIDVALRDTPAPAGVHTKVAGENEEMRRTVRSLAFAFLLAVTLMYMILAADFESFVHPFTVLLSVPLGVFGAFVALWITGAGLNTVSMIGIVVLVGIVDNDAVVKVDFINQMRRQGLSVRDSIREAGHHRLRPIVINTITAIFGVLPMALGIGPGASLQAPLAIAMLGGLTTSTALTLIVIPVVYDLLDQLGRWLSSVFGVVTTAAPAVAVAHAPVPATGD